MATKKKKAAKGKHTARRSGYEVEISLGLFGLGALLVVMLFVEGQALWSTLRGWLFGVFGLNMYLLGMALILIASLRAELCDPVAALLPLLFVQLRINLTEFFRRDGEKA